MVTRPFQLQIHYLKPKGGPTVFAIEMSTLKGRLGPAYVSILEVDRHLLTDRPIGHGVPKDAWFARGLAYLPKGCRTRYQWHLMPLSLPISPFQAVFLYCTDLPSYLVFGAFQGEQHRIAFVDPDTHANRGLPGPPPFGPANVNSFAWACFAFSVAKFK